MSREDRDMKVRVLQVDRCEPIERTDALKNASLRRHPERELVKGPVQDAQVKIGRNPPPFFGYDEVRAEKPRLHLGWRDRLYRVLQQDRDFRTQERGILAQHRGEPNAPELGRTPGELNRVAKPDGTHEPARRPGER